MSHQIDEEQFKKILRYVQSGVDGGATLVAGGDRAGNRGFYIQPTVFADAKVSPSPTCSTCSIKWLHLSSRQQIPELCNRACRTK